MHNRNRNNKFINDGMPYDPIQGQGHETEILQFSKSISDIFNESWQMTIDSETTEQYLIFMEQIFDICPSFLCHVTTNLERRDIDSYWFTD